jgi:hypothetical protein
MRPTASTICTEGNGGQWATEVNGQRRSCARRSSLSDDVCVIGVARAARQSVGREASCERLMVHLGDTGEHHGVDSRGAIAAGRLIPTW